MGGCQKIYIVDKIKSPALVFVTRRWWVGRGAYLASRSLTLYATSGAPGGQG